MSTLYIDRKNTRMTVSGNTLVFYENGERASTLPLHLIDRICIKGDLALSAADLGKLGEHNIGVLILSGREQQPPSTCPARAKTPCAASPRRTSARTTPSASSRHKPGLPKKSSANRNFCATCKPARITAGTKSTNPSHNSNSAVVNSKKP